MRWLVWIGIWFVVAGILWPVIDLALDDEGKHDDGS